MPDTTRRLATRPSRAASVAALVFAVAACGSGASRSTAASASSSTSGSSPPYASSSASSWRASSSGAGGASSSTGTGGESPDAGAGGAGGSATDGGDASAPPTCGVPFSPTGPWCYRLAATTPIASNSAAVVANIQTDIENNYGTFSINTDTYSSPLYVASPSTPATTWSFNDCQHKGSVPPVFAAVLMGVPTIAGMVASQGTDQEITIYDPNADQEWEFWVAGQTNGAWSACWGGTIQGVSKNLGIFPPGTGASASGLPLLGYITRIAELQAGLIQHAVNIEVVRTQATNFSWPANRTDGNTADPDVLMEGQRLRLDPTFDVSTLPNSAERTIAKALQDYGAILTDTSGAVVLQAEDERPYMTEHGTTTNPYDAIFEGRAAYDVLKELPLDKLQVLPQDYGKSFMH